MNSLGSKKVLIAIAALTAASIAAYYFFSSSDDEEPKKKGECCSGKQEPANKKGSCCSSKKKPAKKGGCCSGKAKPSKQGMSDQVDQSNATPTEPEAEDEGYFKFTEDPKFGDNVALYMEEAEFRAKCIKNTKYDLAMAFHKGDTCDGHVVVVFDLVTVPEKDLWIDYHGKGVSSV